MRVPTARERDGRDQATSGTAAPNSERCTQGRESHARKRESGPRHRPHRLREAVVGVPRTSSRRRVAPGRAFSRTAKESGRLRSGAQAISPYLLGGLLTVTGSLHFISTRSYAAIVPRQLPSPDGLVYASGVAELLCAAGLAIPRTRRVAGWATAALFVVVFPANVQMAVSSGSRSAAYQAMTWARLPMQLPLIGWAVLIARRAARHRG